MGALFFWLEVFLKLFGLLATEGAPVSGRKSASSQVGDVVRQVNQLRGSEDSHKPQCLGKKQTSGVLHGVKQLCVDQNVENPI